ncbi:hypothetical protein K437DRAFT_107141 [Tilletiaria anomala UBC 951]|uniref:Uncharacterized protein n=1 Tax=Tilletiaria anomala (strain ATCC 24038 / CBS 436.72 / UBC 951) TaxID=1037660 RepID=A0A066VXK8_TILAU|nr:uncharacterized protein K437DRAFT_107141 [Tilletiaria anomala UBC 951]KDN46437.1 hypothetical protein K437DRAFT_107141 [Tilletiaria anomala UBC 951]
MPFAARVVSHNEPKAPMAHLGSTLHSFAMIHAGVLIAVVSVLNFSQAFATALALGFPLALSSIFGPGKRRWSLLRLLMILVAVVLVTEALLWRIPHIVDDALVFLQNVLDELLWDWQVLRSSTVPYFMLGVLPIILEASSAVLLDMHN